jgi:hypothetical protein
MDGGEAQPPASDDGSLLSLTIRNPPLGRSALDARRSKPPEPEKRISISAKRGDDGSGGDLERAARIRELNKRLKRSPGASPLRGQGKPMAARRMPPSAPQAATGALPTSGSAATAGGA